MILDFRGFRYAEPDAFLTEIDGRFIEIPARREVDPLAWILAPYDGFVAGVLAYELAWLACDVRAPRPHADSPRVCVGRFPARTRSPALAAGGALDRDVACRITPEQYQRDVRRCIDEIVAGELFEVNYTARFDAVWRGTPEQCFARMSAANAGDYFGLLQATGWAVVSVSPESFIEIRDGVVTARPIKGTRKRSDDPVRDEAAARELLASEKDRAENVMIVDLMRNDLTRVCELGTVEVAGLCELESFADVHHLVSTVRGRLHPNVAPVDAMMACFPAGSITGAPKLRAIEIAAQVETGARGPYTGAMFVADREGLESSVLIRTATLTARGHDVWDVAYGAGGAVVADSDPAAEWDEALAKSGPLRRIGS